ncbi:unnamed protein product [Cylicocyclus nassatus]|uniref:Uncharacterized protein n=1 Tax=Cylicocyclus nassatus TaxID=53992 RepID=A0AA36GQ94_CYLNA|nr:unnamed protein product [Cylicocyclus nassatus]
MIVAVHCSFEQTSITIFIFALSISLALPLTLLQSISKCNHWLVDRLHLTKLSFL